MADSGRYMIRSLVGALGLMAFSVGLNMVASELFGYGTRAGLWFVRQAVRLLPPDQRDRWCEEWEADVIEVAKGPNPSSLGGNHHLTAMVWGFWTLRTAVARSRVLVRWAHSPSAEKQVEGLVFVLFLGFGVGLGNGPVSGLFAGLGGGLGVLARAWRSGWTGRPAASRRSLVVEWSYVVLGPGLLVWASGWAAAVGLWLGLFASGWCGRAVVGRLRSR